MLHKIKQNEKMIACKIHRRVKFNTIPLYFEIYTHF